MDINESPLYVLLNPSINHARKDLPITIFESGTTIYIFYYCVGAHGLLYSRSVDLDTHAYLFWQKILLIHCLVGRAWI